MKKSFAIGKYIVKENLSNKILNGFIIFAIVILFGTLLLKELTIFNGEKIIKDIGMLVEIFNVTTYHNKLSPGDTSHLCRNGHQRTA